MRLLSGVVGAILWMLGWVAAFAEPMKIAVSVPGPRNISYLPIDLIGRIGADRAEGAEVRLYQVGGGAVALEELISRNSDFAVAGLPAAMSLRLNGANVVALAAVDDLPLFVLMVRAGLRNRVKSVADLKGRVIGVNTSTLSSKTTSQQLAELVLQSGGVPPDSMRFTAAGQSWVEQSSLLISGAADALMGDEPFASRLLAEQRVFFLANLADPETSRRIPGAGFLHAALVTRAELAAQEPRKAEAMVRILQRTLRWMASHSAEEIVAALDIRDAQEKKYLLAALKKYRRLYSPDGKLSARQLRETDTFFRAASGDHPGLKHFSLDGMIVDKWAGRKE
jgi:NitT/TauT family transport system substrate-binding protein